MAFMRLGKTGINRDDTVIQVRLSCASKDSLVELADRRRRSLSQQAGLIIEDFLRQLPAESAPPKDAAA